MERFLRRHAPQIAAEGCSVDPDDILHPIHDQVRPIFSPLMLIYAVPALCPASQRINVPIGRS